MIYKCRWRNDDELDAKETEFKNVSYIQLDQAGFQKRLLSARQ